MTKKAIVETGGKQYLVSEGQVFDVDLLPADKKAIKLDVLLVIDGEEVTVGTPVIKEANVAAEVINEDLKSDKVTAIRYKAKKRVHKVHGHRQHHTRVKITKIN